MTMSFQQLLAMVGRSIQSPREGAAEVLALGIPREAIWLILGTVVVLSVILAEVTTLMNASEGPDALGGLIGNPIALGMVQFIALLSTIGAVYAIGRAFGGTGSIEETSVLIAWLQFIMVCVQVVQTLSFVLIPPVGALIGIAALVLFLWLLTNFVAVLHGFRSLGQVFLMIVVSTFTIAFVLSLVLAIFGFGIQIPSEPV